MASWKGPEPEILHPEAWSQCGGFYTEGELTQAFDEAERANRGVR
jgi:hypothetical protein